MVVIADTSPLNYLVLIGRAEVLPELYGSVVIPSGVLLELQHPNAPAVVACWLASQPDWLVVEASDQIPSDPPTDLDPGEAAAIALAEANLPEVLLLMDDDRGRREAGRRGIRTTGTLGVLDSAAAHATNFHVSDRVLRRLLDRDQARRAAHLPPTPSAL